MREIKFRAWDGSNMINVGSLTFLESEEIIVNDELVNIKIMSYVGLKDKNGKEIYEGDIVKTKTSYPEIFPPRPIVFELGCFLVGPKGPPIGFLHEDSEVLGNIYENQNFIFIK